MPHFAKLNKKNIVTYVTVGSELDEGKETELSNRSGEVYKQTSYNTRAGKHLLGGKPFRKNFAGIGFKYDSKLDAFIPPKPYPSWSLNEDTCNWEAPVSYPTDGIIYSWDESLGDWQPVEFEIES